MNYIADGVQIRIGDQVIVEGNVAGTVVCDYDNQVCLGGYEKWLEKGQLADGGTLSSGVMIETKELGFLYYADEDQSILRAET